MAEVKTKVAFMVGIALAGTSVFAGVNAQAARSTTPSRTRCQPVRVTQTDAHRPVTYHFAVTNTTDKPQTVESVRTSCACLKVLVGSRVPRDRDGRSVSPLTAADATERVLPGGVIPFDVILNPAGMEGHIEKRVWVTLAPIGGLPGTARPTRIETFDVAADVRLRLGFKPMDAAFGVIRRSETGREIVAKLSGYVADGVKLGEPLREKNDTMFDVRLATDGKSIIAKFRDRNVLPGIYSETWTIPTSDKEIPEIVFAVSARVADGLSVTPQVVTVGWDEPVCSRFVSIRAETGGSRSRATQDAQERVPPLRIFSAETKPRKWGDVKITPRPRNGWRIDIANIDPRDVRQFSKRPFLEVKTNLPGMESFEIPLRVVNDGGTR